MRAGRLNAFGLVLMGAVSAAALEPPRPIVAAELLARAAGEGSVRVIVELRVAAMPADARQRAIEMAQQAVLGEISHTPHRVLRVYQTVPLLALDVSADALRVLASSAHVAAVQEDTLAAPQ